MLALHRQADGARTARTYCTGGAAVAPERPGSASAAAATSASSGSLAARDRRARARLVQFNASGLRSCEAARESDPLAPPVERRRSPAQRHAALLAQQPAPLAGPEATLGLGELGGLFMAGPEPPLLRGVGRGTSLRGPYAGGAHAAGGARSMASGLLTTAIGQRPEFAFTFTAAGPRASTSTSSAWGSFYAEPPGSPAARVRCGVGEAQGRRPGSMPSPHDRPAGKSAAGRPLLACAGRA